MENVASVSPLSKTHKGGYVCQKPWPEGFYQCGDSGIVLPKNTFKKMFEEPTVESSLAIVKDVLSEKEPEIAQAYRTAFFEAFPSDPDIFVRGEGNTIEEAEESCWKQFQTFLNCPNESGHEFEARGYENGAGFCKHCGMFKGNVIPPIHPCPICGELNWCSKDRHGNFYCEKHYKMVPVEDMSPSQLSLRKWEQEEEEWEREEAEEWARREAERRKNESEEKGSLQ